MPLAQNTPLFDEAEDHDDRHIDQGVQAGAPEGGQRFLIGEEADKVLEGDEVHVVQTGDELDIQEGQHERRDKRDAGKDGEGDQVRGDEQVALDRFVPGGG